MHTLQGIRFLSVGRIDGTHLGLDARWFGARTLALMLVLTSAPLVGQFLQGQGQDSATPFWARLCLAGLIVPAIVLTSLAHELGHALASRLAGLAVRAIVLAPHGGVTIRAGSDQPLVNFLTALAGPLANALVGTLCLWLVVACQPADALTTFVIELAALQLLTAGANLLPIGPMDGQRMLAALQALNAAPPFSARERILPVV